MCELARFIEELRVFSLGYPGNQFAGF